MLNTTLSRRTLKAIAATLLLATGPLAFAQAVSRQQADERAKAAAAALAQSYNQDTGLFRTTGWWNSANAITALADTARITGDSAANEIFSHTFTQAPHKFAGFLNDFYDDEGWWALAWIDVSTLKTKQPESRQALSMAESIFQDMSVGWDDTCDGGIWWKKDKHYKNAIANELFLSVAANLALHTKGKQRAMYLDWANREWAWFSHSGMINADGLVNDGLDSACKNNGRTIWSYNQGVVLGGLAALNHVKRDTARMEAANGIAKAAISHLADAQGVLHDPCEPNCGEDGVQFKGIFMRNLAQLQQASEDASFVQFLQTNAESLWTTARTPENRFNVVWSGPAVAANAGGQASALDALNAAAAVTPK